MQPEDRELDPTETLKLVGEAYKSILRPESFIEVLELWDRNISPASESAHKTIAILEEQLTNAIPLLETSLKSVVNQDELLTRLAEFDRPSLLVSTNGMVIGANPGGEIHFGMLAGDRIDVSKLSREDADQFKQVMKQANEGIEDSFKVITFPAFGSENIQKEQLIACRSIFIEATRIGYIILSAMDLVLSEAGSSSFQKAFGATDAEMKVLMSLISGQRQIDIAARDGVRMDTVKKHIKNLRDKANVPNTTALICLAASFAQISTEHGKISRNGSDLPRSITNASSQTYVVPHRHKIVEVNGLKVEYVDDGPANGEPLLVLHSSMVGFILPPEFICELMDAGYRVITPFRPGNGISDPLDGSFSVEKICEHLFAFADKMGLRQFSVLAGTTGFVFGAHLAAMKPDRVKKLVGIGGYLPINQSELLRKMPPFQRAVLSTHKHSRRLAKFLVLSGYKLYLQLGAHAFMSQMMRHSPADLRVVNDSNSLGAISIGLRIAGAQGVDALLDDLGLILEDWQAVAGRVECKTHLFHGTQDSISKIQDVIEFCNQQKQFDVTVLEDRGQLMIYDSPRNMARLIIGKLKGAEGAK